MYLIVSAFRAGETPLTNLKATIVLLATAELGVGLGMYSGAEIVTGVYKDQREVSVRLDLLGDTTTADAIRQAAIFARELQQETVAVVDSGTIRLIEQGGGIVATGSLVVHAADEGVPKSVDAWTTTTGPASLAIYSHDLEWHEVPKRT